MDKLFSSPEIKRTQLLRARATPGELALIQQKASDAGMSTSDYLRSAAMGKPIRSRTAGTIINELILLNHELRALRLESSLGTELIEEVLLLIATAIEKIPSVIDDE